MVEAICFPNEHRFIKDSSASGGYVCQSCRSWISDEEFNNRMGTRTQIERCEFCKAFHVPARLWGTQSLPAPTG